MARRMLLLAVAVIVSLFTLGAGAQDAPAPGVAVEVVNSKITLRVTQPTDLHAVLEALCQRTKTRCELAPELTQKLVEPTSISGTWKGVVTELLQGENLNYANRGAGPSGLLVIQARRAAAAETPSKAEDEDRKGARRETGYRETTDSPDQEARERQRRDQEQREAAAAPRPSSSEEEKRSEFMGNGGAMGFDRGSSQASEPKMSSQEQQAREAAVWGIISGRTPSRTGPTAPPGMVGLPFPDANGNPILAPATGQGLTAAPFPGPNGQPIPVTPSVPGQPLNPFGIPAPPRP